MGHGAWGMGHGAWGMGHGAWVKDDRAANSYSVFSKYLIGCHPLTFYYLFHMPYALCPMPYALCPMPYALCPMPFKSYD